ncbi:MAG: RloB family protein [Clostridium sp.]|nr:RloB family protein [Clostridium sp.]
MRRRTVVQKRMTREICLVICEGETEKEYVELLKRHYRLPILIKTKITRQDICQRLVSQYINDLGLAKGDKLKVFFIYDGDVESTVKKLMKLDGTLILSNPCIELWFLLHIKDYHKASESNDIIVSLRSSHAIWKNYVKGTFVADQTKCLIENKNIAMERAKKLEWHKNPSTNMHLFIAELERGGV